MAQFPIAIDELERQLEYAQGSFAIHISEELWFSPKYRDRGYAAEHAFDMDRSLDQSLLAMECHYPGWLYNPFG